MRGIYAAGVLDVFHEGQFHPFELAIAPAEHLRPGRTSAAAPRATERSAHGRSRDDDGSHL